MRGYLVIYQQVRSWIRMRESRDGLRREGVFAELRLIPAPALDAGEAAAAVALCRVNLDNRRRCHFRCAAAAVLLSGWPRLHSATFRSQRLDEHTTFRGSGALNRKKKLVQRRHQSPALGLPLFRVGVYARH